MQLALIHEGRVQAESDAETAALKKPDGEPMFDIRDVSKVVGIAPGWIANADGSFAAPPEPDPELPPATAHDPVANMERLRAADPDNS